MPMPKKINQNGTSHNSIVTKTCPTCGTKFIPAPLSIYRIGDKRFCSYTCYVKKGGDGGPNHNKSRKSHLCPKRSGGKQR